MPQGAFAQAAFPDKSKTIRAIVPFSAGSTVDALARVYAQQMGEMLGTNFIVDNRAGAESVIGIQAFKALPADGYAVMFSSISTQLVNPHLFKQLTYDPFKDFMPLGGTMRTPLVMMAGPKFPFKNVKEFVAAAKATPEKYTYASISSTTRLSGAIFSSAAGIKLLNMPYKDFAAMISDVLESRVDVVFLDGAGLKANVSLGMRGLGCLLEDTLVELPRRADDGTGRRADRDHRLPRGLRAGRNAARGARQPCATRCARPRAARR